MKICVELFRYSWSIKVSERKTCYAVGWASYQHQSYDASMLCDLLMLFSAAEEFTEYGELGKQLNGNFLLIVEEGDKVTLISDRLRSYAALYVQYDDCMYVTDDMNKLVQKKDIQLEIDERATEQYLLSNFVFGKKTIYQDLYAIQAGEVVSCDKNGVTAHRYFVWEPDILNTDVKHIEEEAEKLDVIFLTVFERMIRSVTDVDRWIIPLSGGHDSRLVVNYLYKLGLKNVICYSYGIKGNLQSVISEQVAKAVGYQWVFIEYDDQLVNDLRETDLIDQYIEYAFNGTSLPHLQDFLATYSLKKTGILRENDCFVPGHSFDFLAGSHLSPSMLKSRGTNDIIKSIGRHYSSWGYVPRSENVTASVKSLIADYPIKPEAFADFFNWQERQTKFIVNSVRCYEFFGYEWRIPLWDDDLLHYWKDIGYRYRYERNMSIAMDKNFLLTEALQSISFSDDANHLKDKRRGAINRLIPKQVKTWLYRLGHKPGNNYYVNEGSHLVFSKEKGELKEFLLDGVLPKSIARYIFPGNRELRNCEINSLVSLKVVYALFKKNK